MHTHNADKRVYFAQYLPTPYSCTHGSHLLRKTEKKNPCTSEKTSPHMHTHKQQQILTYTRIKGKKIFERHNKKEKIKINNDKGKRETNKKESKTKSQKAKTDNCSCLAITTGLLTVCLQLTRS